MKHIDSTCPLLAVTGSQIFMALAILAIAFIAFLLFLILFEPKLAYRITAPTLPLSSGEFTSLLSALADAQVHDKNRVEVLTDGAAFYEAELAAIRVARVSINLEGYIFEPGQVATRFLDVLTERARAGVQVRLVLDAIGSLTTGDRAFSNLRAAGGQVVWYHPLRWYNFKRLNNRTHRNLIIVDGRVGFIGGAGVADRWLKGSDKQPPWRDTMFRVEGPLVVSLQSTFAENWLEAAEEILAADEHFPADQFNEKWSPGNIKGFVVNSEPSAGRGTRARILFQTLLACARESIHITTPYFLPDRSIRQELLRAVRDRGVQVRVITTSDHCDLILPRRISRSNYGVLLAGGVEIHEYQPAMIHAKSLVIDRLWSVVGSTNFDHRSFGHNDEVNLAAVDESLAERLLADFEADLGRSRAISYEEWRHRSLKERIQERLLWILKRQA